MGFEFVNRRRFWHVWINSNLSMIMLTVQRIEKVWDTGRWDIQAYLSTNLWTLVQQIDSTFFRSDHPNFWCNQISSSSISKGNESEWGRMMCISPRNHQDTACRVPKPWELGDIPTSHSIIITTGSQFCTFAFLTYKSFAFQDSHSIGFT